MKPLETMKIQNNLFNWIFKCTNLENKTKSCRTASATAAEYKKNILSENVLISLIETQSNQFEEKHLFSLLFIFRFFIIIIQWWMRKYFLINFSWWIFLCCCCAFVLLLDMEKKIFLVWAIVLYSCDLFSCKFCEICVVGGSLVVEWPF